MTDPIESPEAFTSRLVCNAHDYDAALPLIRSRDAAVRREALREAARVCDVAADDYRNRRTTPNWTAEDAATRIRALADSEEP